MALIAGQEALIAKPQNVRVDLQEQTWTKVQYLGGALGVQGKVPFWKNPLTISPKRITLQIYKGPLIEIDPSRVTAIGYTGHVMNRDETVDNLTKWGLVGPALLVLAVKSKSHYIGIEYLLPDNRKSGVLLRVDKNNYQEIVDALKEVTHLADGSADPL